MQRAGQGQAEGREREIREREIITHAAPAAVIISPPLPNLNRPCPATTPAPTWLCWTFAHQDSRHVLGPPLGGVLQELQLIELAHPQGRGLQGCRCSPTAAGAHAL